MANGKRKLEIVITATARKAEKVFQSLKRGIGSIASAGAKIGAGLAAGFSVATVAIAAFTSSILNSQDSLAKTARQLGVSNEGLAALRQTAKFAGIEVSAMDKALQFMQRNIAEAADGTAAQADAFNKLGLSIEEIKKASPEEAMQRITEALRGVDNQTEKTQIAMDIFGRSGAQLLNTTNEAFERGRKEVELFGIAMDSVSSDEVEAINDNVTTLKTALGGLGTQIVAAFSEPLLKASEAAKALAESGNLKLWATQTAIVMVQAFNGVVQTVGFLGESIIAAGRGLNFLRQASATLIGAAASAHLENVNKALEEARIKLHNLKAVGGKVIGSEELESVQRLTTLQGKLQAAADASVETYDKATQEAAKLEKLQGQVLTATDATVASLKDHEVKLQAEVKAQEKSLEVVEKEVEKVSDLSAQWAEATKNKQAYVSIQPRADTGQRVFGDPTRIEELERSEGS